MSCRWLEALIVRCNLAFTHDSRPLTESERRDAADVFGTALDLDPVRIVQASIVNSPTALGNVIRIPAGSEIDGVTLVHELAHVWQFQTSGTGYISDSLWCQFIAILTTGSRHAAYHVSGEDLAVPSLHELPAEKQAVIIERWFANPVVRHRPEYQRFLAQVRASSSTNS